MLGILFDGDFDSKFCLTSTAVGRSIGWRPWCKVENILDIQNAIIHCHSPLFLPFFFRWRVSVHKKYGLENEGRAGKIRPLNHGPSSSMGPSERQRRHRVDILH